MIQLVATETLRVWPDEVPDGDRWQGIGEELERPRRENSRLVRNVSQPSLTVFLPEPSIATGTGIVVCPGGGFHFLMVDKEGTEVAHWLNARGVAAFVLKYRLVPTPDDDDLFNEQANSLSQRRAKMEEVWPASIADGHQALRVVRQQAQRWGIRPDRLGIMGFSAGGVVTAGVASDYDADSRPSFAAPIYGVWTGSSVRNDAPPLFLAAASDDDEVDARESVKMYSAWKTAGATCELHLYAHGGHGFGLIKKGVPSDGWIDRFWEWLQAEQMVPSASSPTEGG
jgi:acetyl esterase/lipase